MAATILPLARQATFDKSLSDVPLSSYTSKIGSLEIVNALGANLLWVGNATCILEYRNIRFMTDPNFLHQGLRVCTKYSHIFWHCSNRWPCPSWTRCRWYSGKRTCIRLHPMPCRRFYPYVSNCYSSYGAHGLTWLDIICSTKPPACWPLRWPCRRTPPKRYPYHLDASCLRKSQAARLRISVSFTDLGEDHDPQGWGVYHDHLYAWETYTGCDR